MKMNLLVMSRNQKNLQIKNKNNEMFISAKNSKVPVIVIKTDEEQMIALDTKKLLKL